MIAAQKHLIENADTVQEKIAQVQREGKMHRLMKSKLKMVWMSTHEWNYCHTEILKNEWTYRGMSSVNKSVSKQYYK